MKTLVSLLLIVGVLGVATADDKKGRLFGGPSAAPATPAVSIVPVVTPPTPAAAPAAAASDEADGESTIVLDVKLNNGDGESGVPSTNVFSFRSPALPSSLLSFASSLFGANPTARDLRRPLPPPVVLTEVEPMTMPTVVLAGDGDGDSAGAPPPNMFGSIFESIHNALFGGAETMLPPSPLSDVPPPGAVTSSRFFSFRPSGFFSSLLGPSPTEVMAPAGPDAEAGGPVVFAMSTTIGGDDGDDDAAVMGPRVATVEDAGMHRVGGKSRLGKLFNRVMRFLHRRPQPPIAQATDATDASDDDATEEAPKDDDDDSSDAESVSADDSEEDAASDESDKADADAKPRWGHRFKRWWHGVRDGIRGGWRHWRGRWRRHHRACKRDAKRLCPEAKARGGFMAVFKCMVEHRSELSDDCTGHLQHHHAFNCANDAMTLCPEAHSRHALKKCLRANRNALSRPCIDSIKQHHKWCRNKALHNGDVNPATDSDSAAAPAPSAATPEVAPVFDSKLIVPSDFAPSGAPAESAKKPTIAIELQTVPGSTPHVQYSGSAKPAPAAAAASNAAPLTPVRAQPPSKWSAATAAFLRLPKWAIALIAISTALVLAGTIACAVAACRRRASASAAAAASAAAKQPRVVIAAPGAVQITPMPVAAARVQVHAAQPAAAAPAPLVSVAVAAV